jgi:3-hydroxy-9,10-secoandrosta-1,3,5(10)-triene-9,17-dione monooxygenase
VSENVGQVVIGGVRELLPVLREQAQETEDRRNVPAESVKALTETGFFRLLQPAGSAGTRPTRSRS